ncbi:methyl-accepting chemotaxis protein [Paenibacillus aestuarii]|uniref:Methyl-accepting chemotaxis protein n=1 Tax=Paenibacillus aestuarii TaxID=516965 RepID=A0ABW0KF18_9BACL|nr:methyl-accepting chemotaxis protein [Paenibacillus aestuarii]
MKNNQSVPKGKSRLKVSLSSKIIGAFVIVSLLVGATSGLSYTYLNRVDKSYAQLLSDNVSMLKLVSAIKEKTQIQNSLLFGYVLDPNKDKEKQLSDVNTALTGLMSDMNKLTQNEEEHNAIQSMVDSNQTFARLVKKVTDYANQGDVSLAKAEATQWAIPTTETLTQAANKIEELEKGLQDEASLRNHNVVLSTIRTFIWVSAAAFLFAIVIGFVLSRMIVRPVRLMVRAAERIAESDLTVSDIEVKNRDELRELAVAFNQMKANLHSLISEVGGSAKQVAAASEALSAGSTQVSIASEQITNIVQEISFGTEAQVSSVHQGVGIMEEMSSAVDRIAGVTQVANLKSTHAQTEAEAGNAAVETAIAQMNAIHERMKELAATVHRLGARSEQIVGANSLIAGIARQTNMLALNASIEAARAGAAGKGFAVVADEVRKLSIQTGEAAAQIADLVESIQSETLEVAARAEAGSQEVTTGLVIVGEAKAAFTRIQGAMDELACQIGEVTERSDDIADKTRAAVEVIRSIHDVAGQTASGAKVVSFNVESQYASMQEMVSSASILSSMAEDLHRLIGKFRI